MTFATPAAVLAAAVAVLGALPAAAQSDGTFRTPSGNIGCGYYEHELRCDVRDGIVPRPARPSTCPLDYGQGFWLKKHGTARYVCAGDTALNPTDPHVVAYGTTWHGDGIACASSSNGLRCTNADGHGFFIARGAAHRF